MSTFGNSLRETAFALLVASGADTMDPIEKLKSKDPAFKDLTKENITDYFALFIPQLIVQQVGETIDPLIRHLSESTLGTYIMELFPSTPLDSDRYITIGRYLKDQAIITRNPAINQVVIFDLVMDSSAYRLPEMAGCRVFDMQFSAVVMEEKDRLLRSSGAPLLAKERQVICTEYRTQRGWHRQLMARGFKPDEPTLWVVGSQLSYMSVKEGAHLVSLLELLSAPGSQIFADMFSGHQVNMTGDDTSVVTVHAPASIEAHGDSAHVFYKLSEWTVELFARRDDELNYFGTMWDPDMLDRFRVQDREAAYLGPWFVVRFTKPMEDKAS